MKILQKFSLKLKLTLLFGVIFTGLLTGFSIVLYKEFNKIQSEEFDTTLYNYAIDVAEALDIDSYGEVEFDPDIIKLNEKILPFALGTSYITVLDINGKIIARSSNSVNEYLVPLSETTLGKVLKKGASFETHSLRDASHRVIAYLLPVLKIDSPLILQISVPMTSIVNTKKNLMRFFATSIPLIMFFSLFVGYFFVRRALIPMMEIISKTKKIEVNNLQERVPVPPAEDEIWQLANTINHLLSRISESFESQERFIQDASHQLKTPLAIIKGELELFKSEQKTPQEMSEFVESMLQEINFLTKLTNDLLILARVDSGASTFSVVECRIDEILISQVSRLSKFASLKKISLQIDFISFEKALDNELMIKCDPDLLGILFYNLIENAIKYSPESSTVTVKGVHDADELIVVVKDEGEGIEPDQLEKIFNRFFRVNRKSNQVHGSGLGLAICKIVADSFGATLWAENNVNKGASFYFKIKRSMEK